MAAGLIAKLGNSASSDGTSLDVDGGLARLGVVYILAAVAPSALAAALKSKLHGIAVQALSALSGGVFCKQVETKAAQLMKAARVRFDLEGKSITLSAWGRKEVVGEQSKHNGSNSTRSTLILPSA